MTDHPPDRLSTSPRSPYYRADLLERGVGIRFNGKERHDVEEYCVSEGWIRVAVGKALDRRGQPLTVQRKGSVEAYFQQPDAQAARSPNADPG
ncbi:MAG: DUF3297 family protein [Gammaproteobacteria bacterium]|nr:DUF3297 family protein [Gammaproteobacteria bacterium]